MNFLSFIGRWYLLLLTNDVYYYLLRRLLNLLPLFFLVGELEDRSTISTPCSISIHNADFFPFAFWTSYPITHIYLQYLSLNFCWLMLKNLIASMRLMNASITGTTTVQQKNIQSSKYTNPLADLPR